MPLRNRKDIISSLRRLETTLSHIDRPDLKGSALKEMELLLDTFGREKKSPRKPRGG